MKEILSQSIFFGIAITLVTYEIGLWIKQKTGKAIANPLLISVILIVAVLLLFHIDYETYANGAQYISIFLTPATVSLAASVSSAGAVKDLSQGHFRRNHRRRSDCHGERFCFKSDVRSES